MIRNLLQITFSSDVRVCREMTRDIKLCNSAKGNVPGTLEEHTPHEGTKTPLNMQWNTRDPVGDGAHSAEKSLMWLFVWSNSCGLVRKSGLDASRAVTLSMVCIPHSSMMCVCVCACVRACARACMRACVSNTCSCRLPLDIYPSIIACLASVCDGGKWGGGRVLSTSVSLAGNSGRLTLPR